MPTKKKYYLYTTEIFIYVNFEPFYLSSLNQSHKTGGLDADMLELLRLMFTCATQDNHYYTFGLTNDLVVN